MPFSIKDSIDTAGIPTQRGSRLFAGNIPAQDATAVARMKQAGAIPLMKINLPEFSLWWETDNALTGRTNNPWNLERTSGGSSGGEAAAIAAGMSPLGLGSDVGISVRGPAALTGIAALKATHGRIPCTGLWPQVLNRFWHIGPMARSVRDVAAAFGILAGSDGCDGYAIHSRNAAPADAPMPGCPLRVGWLVEPGFGPVHPEVAAAIAEAADRLKTFGCAVEQVRVLVLEQIDCAELSAVLFADCKPYLLPIVTGREAELSPRGHGRREQERADIPGVFRRRGEDRGAEIGLRRLLQPIRRAALPCRSVHRAAAWPGGLRGQWAESGAGADDARHHAVQSDRTASPIGAVPLQLRRAAY